MGGPCIEIGFSDAIFFFFFCSVLISYGIVLFLEIDWAPRGIRDPLGLAESDPPAQHYEGTALMLFVLILCSLSRGKGVSRCVDWTPYGRNHANQVLGSNMTSLTPASQQVSSWTEIPIMTSTLQRPPRLTLNR